MKTSHLILVLSALLSVSCSVREEDSARDVAFADGTAFWAELEDASDSQTKVYADDKLRVLWDADDRVTIFNKYTYNQEYRFAGRTGDNSGAFKIVPGDDFVTGNELDLIYAVYPYREDTYIDNDGLLTLVLPEAQAYREGSFGRGANTMVSVSTGNQLLFKNLCGYLSLKLYGENVSVASISIKGNNDEPLAGEAFVTASPDNAPSLAFADAATGEIFLNMDEPVLLGSTAAEATTFWIVIPPVTFSGGFTLTVTDTNGGVFEKKTSKAATIERNSLFRMSALQVTPSGAVDISAVESANCYMIPAAGSYKFRADVKGGGQLPLDGTVASAEVLWESNNTAVAPEIGGIVRNVRYENGFIFFETTGIDGNALIAAKDASGEILWSWHLWATPYTPETEYDTYVVSRAEMMNRNLGALSKTPGDPRANGLFYQWGRKDPFLGSSFNAEANTCAAAPEGVANQMVYSSQTVEYAVKHPTCFINVENMDWFSPVDYTLWGNEKTIYDPCPPGWKVPSASVFTSWEDVSPDTANYGVLFGEQYSVPATWFPFSGQIYGELSSVGERFDHWTVTTNGAAAVSPHSGPDYFTMTDYYDASGIGQSVRCVRSNYEEFIPERKLSEIATLADNTPTMTLPAVVMAKSRLGVIIDDGTGQIFVFSRRTLQMNEGDEVQFKATKITYRGLPELTDVQQYTVLSVGNPVSYPVPENISYRTDYDDSFFADFQYVSVTGRLIDRTTGTYGYSYIVRGTGDEAVQLPFYIFYPYWYQNEAFFASAMNQMVRIDGYYGGMDSSVCVFPTSIEIIPEGSYIDEKGNNYGQGIDIAGVVWAPVNCGYDPANYPYGKMYQWGRKYGQGYTAPFYAPADEYDVDPDVPVFAPCWDGLNEESDEGTFYYGTNAPYDWIASGSDTYWNLGTGEAVVKNETYAPCPEGWRVPTSSELSVIVNAYHSDVTEKDGVKGIWFSGDPSLFTRSDSGADKAFFPLAGGRFADQWFHDCKTSGRGSSFNLWSSSIGGNGNPANITYSDDNAHFSTSYRAFGFSVRCCKEGRQTISVSSLSLNKDELFLSPGESEQLAAIVLPADATNKNVTWSSSDERIIIVSNNGIVTAISPGTAVIKAESVDGAKNATCVVTVLTIPLNQVWYTSSDGQIIQPSSETVFYGAEDQVLSYTNIWNGEKWVMEFSAPLAYWVGFWFHNYPGSQQNRLVTLGLPLSVDAGKVGNDRDIPFYAAGLQPTIELFYGDYKGIADNGHLLLIGEDYSMVLGCATAYSGTITVPEGVTKLHGYAFHCSRVNKLILPSTIQEMDEYCLEDCDLLTEIDCYATSCPVTYKNIWKYNTSEGVLHYPANSDYSAFYLPAAWSMIDDL